MSGETGSNECLAPPAEVAEVADEAPEEVTAEGWLFFENGKNLDKMSGKIRDS